MDGNLDMSESSWDVVSEPAQILVKTLCRGDAKQRPVAAFIKEHPWLRVNAAPEQRGTGQLDAALSHLRSSLVTSAVAAAALPRIPTSSRLSARASAASNSIDSARSVSISEHTGSANSSNHSSPLSTPHILSANASSATSTPKATVRDMLSSGGASQAIQLRPIVVLVLSRERVAKADVFRTILAEEVAAKVCFVALAEREAGQTQRIEFRLLDIEMLQSAASPGKLYWHPLFRNIDVVLVIESMADGLQQDHAQDAFRQVFSCEHFTAAPVAVPIVLAMTELSELRKVLIRDKWFGPTAAEPGSAEYQRKENRLILSITDRYEQIVKTDPTRPFRLVLLPSGSSTPAAGSNPTSNPGSPAPVDAATRKASGPDNRRSFTVRRATLNSLQDISARYSALTPSALAESGVEALRRALLDGVLNSVKDDLASPTRPASDPAIVQLRGRSDSLKIFPANLRSLTLRKGSFDVSRQLIASLPPSLEFLSLDGIVIDEGLAAELGERVRAAAQLRQVALHNAGLTAAVLSKLLPALLSGAALEVLDVSCNPCGDEGMEVLADALVANCSVRRLHAMQSNVTVKGLLAWREVLLVNHVLELLDLSDNADLGSCLPEVRKLMHAAKDNALLALQRLILTPELSSQMLVPLNDRAEAQRRYGNDSARFVYLCEAAEPTARTDLSYCRLRRLPFSSDAAFDHVTHLNVSHNPLGALPDAVFSMVALEELVAISCSLSGPLSSELKSLNKLQSLALSQNEITRFPDVLCSQLSCLQSLDLRFNQLGSLPESISHLVALKHLFIQQNHIVSLPQSIFQLQQICSLECHGNPMHTVLVEVYRQFALGGTTLDLTGRGIVGLPPEVAMLSKCTEIVLAHNMLSWLPPQIANMSSLVVLDISRNCFDRIPAAICRLPLTMLKFDNNPLRHVQPEVLAMTPLRRMLETAALQSVTDKVVPLTRVRLMVIGEKKAGKTTLANLMCGTPEKSASAANLVEIREWSVDESLALNVWDFGGTSCRELFPLFASERTIYVLAVSLDTEAASVTNVRYWLENLKMSCPKSSVVIVGTHTDVADQKGGGAAMEKKLRDMAQQYGQVKGVLTTTGQPGKKGAYSALEAKVIAVARAQSHIGETVSVAFHELSEALQVQRAIRSPPVMRLEQVVEMALQVGMSEAEGLAAVTSMHEMGLLLASGGHVVLDMMWLSALLGLLVNSSSRLSTLARDGWLSQSQFVQMWSLSPLFAKQDQSCFVPLLEDLKIVCRVGASSLTVPFLLPDERPQWLWAMVTGGRGNEDGSENSAEVRRVFSQTMVGFGATSRFLAEVASLVNPIRMWKHLMVAELRDDSHTKLSVECQVSHTGGGTFDVRAKGKNGPAAIALIIQALDKLASVGSRPFLEMLPTFCGSCGETHPVMRADIDAARQQLKPYYLCPNGYCLRLETIVPDLNLAQSFAVLNEDDVENVDEVSGKLKRNGALVDLVLLDQAVQLRDAWAGASLTHPHIVSAVAVLQERVMVFEMTSLGSLDKLLDDVTLQVEWRLVLRIARDVAEGLRFAHIASPTVVHGNLSASCVMLCSLDVSAPVVARVSGFCGRSGVTWQEDVAAFGRVLLRLLTRDAVSSDLPIWCPVPYASLIRLCLHKDPAARPTFREIKAELLEIEATTHLTLAQMKKLCGEGRASIAEPTKKFQAWRRLGPTAGVAARPADAAVASPGTRRKKVVRKKKMVRKKRVAKKKNITLKVEESEASEIAPEESSKSVAVEAAVVAAAPEQQPEVDSVVVIAAPSSPGAAPPRHIAAASKSAKSFTLRFGKGVALEEELETDIGSDDDAPDSAMRSSSSMSSSSSEQDDESGPCLACRMEKRCCLSFKTAGDGVLCGTCGHAADAHASRLHVY